MISFKLQKYNYLSKKLCLTSKWNQTDFFKKKKDSYWENLTSFLNFEVPVLGTPCTICQRYHASGYFSCHLQRKITIDIDCDRVCIGTCQPEVIQNNWTFNLVNECMFFGTKALWILDYYTKCDGNSNFKLTIDVNDENNVYMKFMWLGYNLLYIHLRFERL